MTAKKTALANADLDAHLANTWLALFTVAPSETTDGTEVSGHAYARQAITWGAAAGGVKTSTADILFPFATSAYGSDVVAVAVCDALTAGNQRYFGALSSPLSIGEDQRVAIPAGALIVSEAV